jgi:hypothetical protein
MIAYTTDQVFILLGETTCKKDLLRVWKYIIENKKRYSLNDLQNFKITFELMSIVWD